MNGQERVERSWRGGSAAAFALCFGLLCGLGVAGCSDHRISLTEFLEMQTKMREAETPSEPAPDQEAARALIDRQLGPYKVGPSDVLAVTATGADQAGVFPPIQVRVDRNGEIDLPIVGQVKVADLELEDVEDAIHRACVPAVVKDAAVHVELVSVDTTNVLALGAVTFPGLVELRRTERNMLHAIVAAGGVSELASGRATLRRIRQPGDEVTLDLTDPQGLKVALALAPLEHGDIVTVHAAVPNTVFVGGLVNAPRSQTYPPGVQMTVLQALAASAGLRTDVTPREATLIRRLPNGEDAHVRLDLDRITTGKDPNIVLAAGDVLWVPETVETRVQDWVNRNIFIRAGISATAGATYSASALEYMNRNAERESLRGFQAPGLQETFDPFGSLIRSATLERLSTQPPPP